MQKGLKSDASPPTSALERKVRDLEQWVGVLRAALESAAEGVVVVDDDGTVLYCNETYLRMWRLDRAMVVGRPYVEIARHISAQFTDPAQFLSRVEEICASPDEKTRDLLQIADGRVYERISKVQRRNEHAVGRIWRVRDVTNVHELTHTLERRVAERTKALDRTERQFQQLVNGVRDCAIFMLDPEGRIVSWNPGAERIKGYAANEVIGEHFSLFYTAEDRANNTPQRTLDIARVEGKYEGEAWRLRKDGTRFWASVLIDAIHNRNGRLVGFAKITRDMTERRAMQEQLHQSQKMEALGQLTGGVAHDFNNLLTVVLGNLETVARHIPDDARLRRAADQAIRGAQRAATLTQQLLAFARRQPLNPEPADVNALVTGMWDLIRSTLGERINPVTELQADVWPVEIDPNLLENAILNLTVNSRDAMPEGGTVTIETRNLTLTARDVPAGADINPGEYVLIRVADTGIGMSSDILEHAFEPFFTTKPVGEGTGLGLSQVFGFVKQSGGHIEIASEAGRGTTVMIYLPRLEGEASMIKSDARPPIERGQINAAPLTAPKTALVIDDEILIGMFLADVLQELGFTVTQAASAAEGLAALDDVDALDVAFIDIGLPDRNGIELARELRERVPNLKIALASGYRDDLSETLQADPDVTFLPKPFDTAAVKGALGTLGVTRE